MLVFEVVQLFKKPQIGHRRGLLLSHSGVILVKNIYIEFLGTCIFILRWHGLETSLDEEAARWGGKHGRDKGTTGTISTEA